MFDWAIIFVERWNIEENYRNLNYILRDPGYVEASENLCSNWANISDTYEVIKWDSKNCHYHDGGGGWGYLSK